MLKKRRRKYQRKQDLAAIKATWALFQQISADTKDLDDLPHYWPQAQRLHLPIIQYTAREVRSGLLFWSFAERRTAAASAVFAARVQQHLARYGVCLRDLVWQTDNGSEFVGGHDQDGKPTGFPAQMGDSEHVRIPPAAHTYQSDVETVHRLEQDEFFDLETFTSRGDFLAKVHTYQLYFNLVRPNSHKENLTPWQIIERLAPRSPLELCLLPPVFLDYYINDSGGYDLPRLPYRAPGTGTDRKPLGQIVLSAYLSCGDSCAGPFSFARVALQHLPALCPRLFGAQDLLGGVEVSESESKPPHWSTIRLAERGCPRLAGGEDPMSQRPFSFVAGLIFLVVAVAHVLRLAFKWEVVLNGWPVPMWISAVALVIAAFLAYEGLRLGKS